MGASERMCRQATAAGRACTGKRAFAVQGGPTTADASLIDMTATTLCEMRLRGRLPSSSSAIPAHLYGDVASLSCGRRRALRGMAWRGHSAARHTGHHHRAGIMLDHLGYRCTTAAHRKWTPLHSNQLLAARGMWATAPGGHRLFHLAAFAASLAWRTSLYLGTSSGDEDRLPLRRWVHVSAPNSGVVWFSGDGRREANYQHGNAR